MPGSCELMKSACGHFLVAIVEYVYTESCRGAAMSSADEQRGFPLRQRGKGAHGAHVN